MLSKMQIFEEEIEKIHIVQPILHRDYKALAAEAESLVESAGALCAGVTYVEVREVNPANVYRVRKTGKIA